MAVRRRVLIAVAVLLGGALLAGGWLTFRVVQAAGAMRDLQAAADGARPEVEALDVDALRARLPALQDAAARASDAAGDPVWRAARHLPFVGDDLAAVSAVATAADDLTHDAAPDLLDALGALTTPAADVEPAAARTVPDGWVDLAPLAAAAPAAARAAQAVDDLAADLEPIDPDGLAGPLADPVRELRGALDASAGTRATLADLAAVLPSMLGDDGPRTYLLLSLNPAELRAQGGIVGAVAVLQARDGAVGLVGQRSTADLPELPASVLPLTDEELALFGDRLGRWVQDTVQTPDYPRAAELASAFWTASTGQAVDGVVATDPTVVADLLAATGRTVQADGEELGGDDMLRALLRDAYLAYGDPRAGDLFYAQVATSVFAVLRDAAADPATARAAVTVATDAVADRRVALWSARPDEQARLAGSSVGGAFLSGDPATDTGGVGQAVGVFLDDGTAGKLDYDLTTAVTVTMTGCGTPDVRARVEVALDYHPPGDVAGFPAQVTGDGGSGLPAGWLATNVSFYSARDGRLGEVRRGDAVVGGQTATSARRDVAVLTSRLAPATAEVYTVTVPAPDGALTVWTTPTLTSPGVVTGECPAAP
jgi:outer membrane murein-binding lipoprotein Lpp